jgi:hypothetical protein
MRIFKKVDTRKVAFSKHAGLFILMINRSSCFLMNYASEGWQAREKYIEPYVTQIKFVIKVKGNSCNKVYHTRVY